jgi:protein-tyrosine phosphatase
MPSTLVDSPTQRAIALQGASNFRDLGGYVGAQGRPVQWRKLFRSDHLGDLQAPDIAQLEALGLARVCDFRGVKERAAHPCAMPGPAVHALSIEPTVVQALEDFAQRNRGIGEADAVRLMQQTYRAFVTDNSARYAELFGHLLHNDTPLVFHCTAGKDRTGFAAALILSALGVSREDIMADYLLTNQLYKPPAMVGGEAPPEVRAAVRRVQADYLQASLGVVEADFGGMDNYLNKGIGLSANDLKHLEYLYLKNT